MKKLFLIAVCLTAAFLAGCATHSQVQRAVVVDKKSLDAVKGKRIAILFTPIPKVTTSFPGASCLACLAAANIANTSLINQVQTFSSRSYLAIRDPLANALSAKGFEVVANEANVDTVRLPKNKNKAINFSPKNMSRFLTKYQADYVLVVETSFIGVSRNYDAYVPQGAPKASITGKAYMVDSSNKYFWYQPFAIQAFAKGGKWDEAPQFPGITNAYHQAIESAKATILLPFE